MFKLVQTCSACPEQYDVFCDGVQVGYLRLRHGCFRAEHNGKTVYTAAPDGDGQFEPEERKRYLNAACKAIRDSMAGIVEAEEDDFFEID